MLRSREDSTNQDGRVRIRIAYIQDWFHSQEEGAVYRCLQELAADHSVQTRNKLRIEVSTVPISASYLFFPHNNPAVFLLLLLLLLFVTGIALAM